MRRSFAATAPLPSCHEQALLEDDALQPLTVRLASDGQLQRPGAAPRDGEASATAWSTSARKGRRSHGDACLARAVLSLTACLEDFGGQLETRRAAAAQQEAGLARALRSLASTVGGGPAAGGRSGAAALPTFASAPLEHLPLNSEDSLHEASLATPSAQSATSDIEERLREVLEQIKGGPDGQHGAEDPEARRGEEVDESIVAILEQIRERLQSHQERLEDGLLQQRRALESASEARLLKELRAAVQSLRSPKAAAGGPGGARHHEPQYIRCAGTDGRLYDFPEVQVAIKVYQVGNVDTAKLTFEADFVCMLDWCDPNVQGVPSDELKFLDWRKYFNPLLEIDNAKDDGGWMDGLDEIPRRRDKALRIGSAPVGCRDAGVGDDFVGDSPHLQSGPWLRKTMRFRGTLTMNAVDLRCFPFDVQALPVRLKASCSRGAALGTPLPESQAGRVHLVQSRKAPLEGSYQRAEQRLRGQGHHAALGADESLLEFDIAGIVSGHPDPKHGDVYSVGLIVARPPLGSHFWDLVIMNLLVLLAAAAFFDTAAPELSSRMSISLTVILTLAAYTSARPAPVEKAPYTTLHDWCAKVSMFLVTGISTQNVFATVMCGGQSDEAPPYMIAEFEYNREVCSVGWCKSRLIDCRSIVVFLVTWFVLLTYTAVWLICYRRHAACKVWDLPVPGNVTLIGTESRGGCGLPADRSMDVPVIVASACEPSPAGDKDVPLPSPVPTRSSARPTRARGQRPSVPTPRSPPRTPSGRPPMMERPAGSGCELVRRSPRDVGPSSLGRSYKQLAD